MITLASVGDLPALPLGMSYPKRKNWLLGKPTRSKRIRFSPVKKESMNFIVVKKISEFFEAVDQKLRAERVWRVFQKGRKLAGQANKFYTRSMGYRQDISSVIPGFPGFNVHPTKKMPIKRGNKAASYDLHHYAQRKSDKALYIARKFANKVKGARPSKEAKPDIGGSALMAAYIFKTRRNRD